jgi:hypothetical protein
MYQFEWLAGNEVSVELREKFASLYSQHYGIWGPEGVHSGGHIKLTSARMGDWLGDDTHVVWASMLGEVVGYAITVQSVMANVGQIAWVTQLVVHEDHRDKNVGKTLR